jgi:hypothetical protein
MKISPMIVWTSKMEDENEVKKAIYHEVHFFHPDPVV